MATAPPCPTDLQILVIPDDYKQYEWLPDQMEDFLLSVVDSGPGPSRILIFSREGNMAWCNEVEYLYKDGTFKQAPPLFHQVYVDSAEKELTALSQIA